MAYGNGRSSSWRKKRNSIVIEQRVTEPQQIHVEGERQAMVQSIRSIKQDEEVGTVEESAQHKEDTRVITRIIDDVKLELLSRCVLGFCRKPRQIFDLANEFHRAYLSGFRLMRVVGSLALLIFYSFEERKRTLELKVLNTWLENVMDWSPTIAMSNRRVWVSVCGIPIHAWSLGTFKNLAERWGDLIELDDTTLDPLNF
ncbi:hypothetical protein V6N12_067853 [Hibiscus sabdariffa]|uniref:DUF4283 domain-containing protein n=1 Tax=Hibiscus sabdariffa TaxID=183260 RepID=A0ABR2FNL2_9ROSI